MKAQWGQVKRKHFSTRYGLFMHKNLQLKKIQENRLLKLFEIIRSSCVYDTYSRIKFIFFTNINLSQ